MIKIVGFERLDCILLDFELVTIPFGYIIDSGFFIETKIIINEE